jgi:glycosyltransferase involved in cell wall biosynthesis
MTNICIVSEIDLSRATGDTIRVCALVKMLQKKFNVNLILPKPTSAKNVIQLDARISFIQSLKSEPIINMLKRTEFVSKIKEVQKEKKAILQIETSTLGGYLRLFGFSNYVLDVHGLAFDELKYDDLPWYLPHQLCINYTYLLEKFAVKQASKVVAVSNPMKNFVVSKWGVREDKVKVIPNGYFEDKIRKVENMKKISGLISFVGLLKKWASVDKVIEAARILKNENVFFTIVGDGPDRSRLEMMVKRYKLNNVKFTGFVSQDRAYEIMSKSEILLAPFPKTIALEVACPIKLLEYMALGKPIVLDNVGEIPAMLKEKGAAIVSDPLNPYEFIENIRRLLDSPRLATTISLKAKKLSKNFTWEKQGEKLIELYEQELNK